VGIFQVPGIVCGSQVALGPDPLALMGNIPIRDCIQFDPIIARFAVNNILNPAGPDILANSLHNERNNLPILEC